MLDQAIVKPPRKFLVPSELTTYLRVRPRWVYALTGKRPEVLEIINRPRIQPFGAAIVYAALGDRDEAFKILDKAIEERSSILVFVKADPRFDSLRVDPRWQALLRRMNFPTE